MYLGKIVGFSAKIREDETLYIKNGCKPIVPNKKIIFFVFPYVLFKPYRLHRINACYEVRWNDKNN